MDRICPRFRRNVKNQVAFQISVLRDRSFIVFLYHH